uniref:30S ribosomal protein S15 n=1 Tax=Nephromyces sp. ex Molgula occidentalis TaxID=2544991 RepID=A0A5C1H8B4_9APIC|nr:hypothetical protein [Nephromyces sp. ex Molgula occidentalis]
MFIFIIVNTLLLYTQNSDIYKHYLFKNTNLKKKDLIKLKNSKYKFIKKLIKYYRILGIYSFKSNNIVNIK